MRECLNDRIKRLLRENEELEKRVAESNTILMEQLTDTQNALTEQYEENLRLSEMLTETQLALCEIYELLEV